MPPRQTVQKIFCKTVSELDWEWEDEVRPSQKTAQLSSRCLQTPLLGISCDPTENKSTDIYWYLQISTDIYLYLQVSVWPLVQRRLAAARMLINDMTTPPPEIRLQWGQEELCQPACQYLHTAHSRYSIIIFPTAPECLLAISRYLHQMQRQNSCCCCNAFHGVNNSLHQLQHQSSHLCRGLSSSAWSCSFIRPNHDCCSRANDCSGSGQWTGCLLQYPEYHYTDQPRGRGQACGHVGTGE